MSVIIPGQDKGKSYIEHTAVRSGTSYKAKLKEAVDRLIPVSAHFEDLLRRLQEQGYEIERGKYVYCSVSDQERFTRLKTLGVGYTEEAIAARIAGKLRPGSPTCRASESACLLTSQIISTHRKAPALHNGRKSIT